MLCRLFPLLLILGSTTPPPATLLAAPAARSVAPAPPTDTLSAKQAAQRPGQYVRVRATVARVYTTKAGYTFLNLDRPRPHCPLEVVVRPDLLPNLTRHLKKRPAELAGRVVLAEGYVQAAEGATAQIWLSRAPALAETQH